MCFITEHLIIRNVHVYDPVKVEAKINYTQQETDCNTQQLWIENP